MNKFKDALTKLYNHLLVSSAEMPADIAVAINKNMHNLVPEVKHFRSNQELRDFIKDLPKAELHVHLDGSLRESTLLDLAEDAGVELPTPLAGLYKRLSLGRRQESLTEVLKVFGLTTSLMQTRRAIEKISFELAADALHVDNVRYMEVRFCPQLHTGGDLTSAQAVQAALDGLRRAKEAYKDIDAKLILCAMRDFDTVKAEEIVDLAISFKGEGVVGVDLAGGEVGNPVSRFKEVFQRASDNGVNVTLHAGEATGPEEVIAASKIAQRIGHATKLAEDKSLMKQFAKLGVPIEACLTSNWQTSSIRKIKNYPLRDFIDAGITVTLNTDNRLVSNITLSDEYFRAAKAFNLSKAELRSLADNSFKSKFS